MSEDWYKQFLAAESERARLEVENQELRERLDEVLLRELQAHLWSIRGGE